MSQKVLQISAEDAKYIDPNQMASITMVDGTTIYINGNAEEGFVEENQAYVDANPGEQVQDKQQQQPQLRGAGAKIAAGLLATGAVVAGAAALGSALKHRGPVVGGPMRGPMMGPGIGMGMRGPGMGMMKPGMAPMGRPGMGMPMGRQGMGMGMPMGRPGMGMPMGRPMGVFRARRQDNVNEEETCPYCNK